MAVELTRSTTFMGSMMKRAAATKYEASYEEQTTSRAKYSRENCEGERVRRAAARTQWAAVRHRVRAGTRCLQHDYRLHSVPELGPRGICEARVGRDCGKRDRRREICRAFCEETAPGPPRTWNSGIDSATKAMVEMMMSDMTQIMTTCAALHDSGSLKTSHTASRRDCRPCGKIGIPRC